MELIYIGDKFYQRSKTLMSSIYTVEGERSDWGFVEVALKNGESVHIRPATEVEKLLYEERLKEWEKKYDHS